MRHILILTLLLLAGPASARFGLGVMVGEPTGLNAKLGLADNRALDAGLAWSLQDNKDMHLHVDYLFHNNTALKGSGVKGKLALYYGIGGRLQLRDDNNRNDRDDDDDDDRIGVRIPLGISWAPPQTPIDLFFELAPIVDLVPDTGMDINGGLGIRFWFD